LDVDGLWHLLHLPFEEWMTATDAVEEEASQCGASGGSWHPEDDELFGLSFPGQMPKPLKVFSG